MNESSCALAQRDCVPCRGGVPPMTEAEARTLLAELDSNWTLADGAAKLERTFRFPNFADALAFVNRIGELAEAQGHHPDIELGWGRVRVTLLTHKIGGLSESDFILAAKTDALTAERNQP